MPRFALLFIALAAAALSGCSTPTPSIIQKFDGTSDSKLVEETPTRVSATCVSTTPLSAEEPFDSLVFTCEDLGTTATLSDMTDAGWRLESVNVGKQSNLNGVISMPITITIRKLF